MGEVFPLQPAEVVEALGNPKRRKRRRKRKRRFVRLRHYTLLLTHGLRLGRV